MEIALSSDSIPSVKHMLYRQSTICLTRSGVTGRIIKLMLEKQDIGARLAEEFLRLGLTDSAVAARADVTLSAVGQWQKSGRFHRKHWPMLKSLGVNLIYVLHNLKEETPKTSRAGHATTARDAEEEYLIEAYRGGSREFRDHLIGFIEGNLRRAHPDIDEKLGPRNVERQRAAEKRLVDTDSGIRAKVAIKKKHLKSRLTHKKGAARVEKK